MREAVRRDSLFLARSDLTPQETSSLVEERHDAPPLADLLLSLGPKAETFQGQFDNLSHKPYHHSSYGGTSQ